MWNCSFFSISSCFLFFFFFFFLITPENSSSTNALSIDLIDTTCKQCANKSTVFNYYFCLTSLQAVPISHETNLRGLAVIAMKLALENATATASIIEKMKSCQAFDPFAKECLMDCSELYADSVPTIMDSIGAFSREQYDVANILMSGVMETAVTCEEGFTEKEGEVTPLTEENYNLFELSDIALCIIKLCSFGLSSMSS